MSRMRMLRNGLFSLVTVAALGFGASQALAAPAAQGSAALACTWEAHNRCDLFCQQSGYDGGWCAAGGGCQCIHY